MTDRVLLGTNFFDAGADEGRRQGAVMDALASLKDVEIVDLQWRDVPPRRPWIRTLPVLRQDSTTVTGCPGKIKPIFSEMFDALADAAASGGMRYFAFFNSDVVVTQAAVELIRTGGRDTYGLARMNHDADGRDLGMYLKGLEVFAFELGWWRAHRWRFRPYILGERSADNVFGAIMMCHGNGVLANREPLVRHEIHPKRWGSGPFDAYNTYLGALDYRYFQMWEAYFHRLSAARARGATEAEERAIADEVFVWRRSAPAALRQAARSMKAAVVYRTRHA